MGSDREECHGSIDGHIGEVVVEDRINIGEATESRTEAIGISKAAPAQEASVDANTPIDASEQVSPLSQVIAHPTDGCPP